MSHEPPDKLDYATPSDPHGDDADWREEFGGCLGSLAFVAGILFLVVGTSWMVRAIRKPNRFFPSDEFDYGAIGLALALVCLIAAYRWHRRPRK